MHTLETPRRFSNSRFWPLMTDYYQRQGPTAWSDGEVPFRITSNPFIANAYAQVIRGYLRDTADGVNGPHLPGGPVTILELGAGSGQFSFLLARALSEVVAGEGLKAEPPFRYLMTDVAESNVRAWPAHPRLKPFVEAGVMEFAVLDASAPAEARLAGSGESLASVIGGNPVVVIANYLLDVLVHDAFQVENGVLQEVRVGLELEKELPEVVGSQDFFKQMRFALEFAPIEWPCYPEPGFDAVLSEYGSALKSAIILFPVSALRCLETLRRLAGGRMLVLVSDKARITPQQLEGHNRLNLRVTGSFSTMVNLDAVARWTRNGGGVVCHPRQPSTRFDTYAFLFGQSATCRETEYAFAQCVERFGPVAYSALLHDVRERTAGFKPRAMLALLRLSGGDPLLVARLEEPLLEAVGAADAEERAGFLAALERAWANYYPIGGPRQRDAPFVFGRLFQRLGQPEKALTFYQASLAEYGAHRSTLLNMGVCYEELGDREPALSCYRRALDLRPDPFAERAVARLTARNHD